MLGTAIITVVIPAFTRYRLTFDAREATRTSWA